MFYKKVNKNNNKQMFEFLKNHFTYYTMSSWNRLESIANNVKIYNLDIKGDKWKLLKLLELDNYSSINTIIEEWEIMHEGYKIGFNGRSAGYLVLYNNNNNSSILSNYIIDSENYQDFKENLKYYGYTLKDYKNELIKMVELVQDFDKLCDDLVSECQYMLDNCDIEEIEETYTKKEKTLVWRDTVCN